MTGKTGVLFIHREGLSLVVATHQGILEARFTPETVSDLEIIKEEALDALVRQFIQNNKIPPTSLVVVLANNVCLVKDFATKELPKEVKKSEEAAIALEETIKEFIAHAPFENVVTQRLPIKNGFRVCIVNQDLYEKLRNMFEKYGLTFEIVVPLLFFGEPLSTKALLDPQLAEEVLRKSNSVRQHNLLLLQGIIPSSSESENTENTEEEKDESSKPPSKNKRIYLLAGVFGVLLVILVVVFFMSQQSNTSIKPTPTPLPPVATPVPPTLAPQVTSQVASSAGTIAVKDLTVQITGNTADAQQLKTQLISDGFTSVIVISNSSVGSAQTIVTFSPRVSTALQNLVTSEVNSLSNNNVKVQNKPDATTDVTILLGQQKQ